VCYLQMLASIGGSYRWLTCAVANTAVVARLGALEHNLVTVARDAVELVCTGRTGEFQSPRGMSLC
jgi:hypothetical protein